MNSFQKKEDKGRETFKTFAESNKITIKRFSTNEYARYDVGYNYRGKKYIGEIKVRDYSASDFTNWYLEVDKYQGLQSVKQELWDKKQEVANITYINHFKDNVTYIWDLTQIDMSTLERRQLLLQKNDQDETKILKWVYMLPHHLADKFETDKTKSIFRN